MIGQSLWKNLKSLVTLDKQIEEIVSKISIAEKIAQTDQQKIPKLQGTLERLQKEYLEEKRNIAQQESTAKELKELETEKKSLLEKTTNPKEQKAAEKEFKNVLQKRMEQDDLLIKTWHSAEEKEKHLEKAKNESAEQIRQLQEGIETQKQLLAALHTEKSDLDQKRLEAIKLIPKIWLDKYENMRNKVQDPIVPVIGGSCSACYYTVLRQDLNQLKKAGVLPCRNCYRFLYFDAEEQTNLKKETY